MRDVAPPTRAYAGQMRWCDLAFLHWPIAADDLRRLLPTGLELDTFDGEAWLGIVPFRMEGVRLRGVPPIPTTHAFPEINVRTYVRAGGRAGVWFLSLDAASRLAVRGARLLYNLPYFNAEIALGALADAHASIDEAGVRYASRRVHRNAPKAEFAADYTPTATKTYDASPGTLEHFLVERYCLFTYDDRRGLGLIDVDHQPWPLQQGASAIRINTMAIASGISLPEREPLVHFARTLDVRAWTRQDVSA